MHDGEGDGRRSLRADILEGVLVVGLCIGGAVVYGVVHDQFTIRLCPEYFTVFHPYLVPTTNPTLLAAAWGVAATWWAGLLLGVPIAVAARAGRRSPRRAAELVRPVAVLLAAMACAAALAGIAGRTLAVSDGIRVHPSWSDRIPAEEHVDFLTALWMHGASYVAGFAGGVVLAVRTWRGRREAPAARLACGDCGEEAALLDGLPPALAFPLPFALAGLTPEEFSMRVETDGETCVLDGEHYFIRGMLQLPLEGGGEVGWTAWSTLSAANFRRARDLWTTPGRESEPPYFGWFQSAIPGYPDTVNLKVHVHTAPVGVRPRFELEPTDHPLAVDQRRGISLAKWRRLVEAGIAPAVPPPPGERGPGR